MINEGFGNSFTGRVDVVGTSVELVGEDAKGFEGMTDCAFFDIDSSTSAGSSMPTKD